MFWLVLNISATELTAQLPAESTTESIAKFIEQPILRVCINEIGCRRNVWGATLRQRQKNIIESIIQSIEKPILRACVNEIRWGRIQMQYILNRQAILEWLRALLGSHMD